MWQSDGQDGSAYGIFGQRFSANGVPRGAEFQVNTYTTNVQSQPAVASDANGNFVVVWSSRNQDGSDFGVFGRRFDAAGTPQSSEFQVDTYTTGFQSEPAVVYLSNGNFVVAWDGFGSDTSMIGVFARQFDANGSPLGSQFQVNSFTTDYQYLPALAADPNGGFVVTWGSYTQDGDDGGVFARRYDAAGAPRGGEFQVNSYTTSSQGGPLVATDASGNFIVVWMSLNQDGNDWGLFAQVFDAAGSRFGSEFQVNTYTTALQGQQRVGVDQKGNFVVVWHSSVQDGSGFGVFGRRLDVFGPAGSEFRVNSYTTSAQATPAMGTSPDGDFVVVWASAPQDGSGWGVFSQRYGDILFQDGFESGDLTRWSSASTDGGDVSVTGGAALANTLQGMQVVVNDTTGVFVRDDSPSAEAHYRARFYFDTNGFDPGEAQSHLRTRIFIAFDNASQRQITIVLRRTGPVQRDGTRAPERRDARRHRLRAHPDRSELRRVRLEPRYAGGSRRRRFPADRRRRRRGCDQADGARQRPGQRRVREVGRDVGQDGGIRYAALRPVRIAAVHAHRA